MTHSRTIHLRLIAPLSQCRVRKAEWKPHAPTPKTREESGRRESRRSLPHQSKPSPTSGLCSQARSNPLRPFPLLPRSPTAG